MAISHIPRSVGHNFTPEYQISAIPRIYDIADSTKVIVRKSDGLIVGTAPAGAAGQAVTLNASGTAIGAAVIFADANDKVDNALHGGGAYVSLKVVKLDKISQWIQVQSPDGSAMSLSFSRKDAANSNLVVVNANTDSYPLRLRCVNIYLPDTITAGIILAGLTVIDRKEFDNVVEKFSGDDITVSV